MCIPACTGQGGVCPGAVCPGAVCPGGLSAQGGCLPRGGVCLGGVCLGGCLPHTPSPCGQNGRCLWKHYLAATTLRMVIKQLLNISHNMTKWTNIYALHCCTISSCIFSTCRPMIPVTISFECCERSNKVYCMKSIDWPNISEKNGFSIAVSIKSTLKLNYQSELKEISGVWSISEPFRILLCLKTAFQEIIIKSNGTLRNQWNILNVSFSFV